MLKSGWQQNPNIVIQNQQRSNNDQQQENNNNNFARNIYRNKFF